jgi:uncharacterized protein (DUF736 family)
MESKPNIGTLFKNSNKQTPKQPDYRGNANVGGIDYELAGWINESQTAGKYLRFTFKPKDTTPK